MREVDRGDIIWLGVQPTRGREQSEDGERLAPSNLSRAALCWGRFAVRVAAPRQGTSGDLPAQGPVVREGESRPCCSQKRTRRAERPMSGVCRAVTSAAVPGAITCVSEGALRAVVLTGVGLRSSVRFGGAAAVVRLQRKNGYPVRLSSCSTARRTPELHPEAWVIHHVELTGGVCG